MEIQKKQSLPLALLLSFLVALAGACAWGLMYTMGWFVSIIAYATAFGMFAVYLKFYNKFNWIPFVWTLAWIIVLNILASIFSIVIAVSIEASVTLGEAFNATMQVLGTLIGQFAFDMFLGTVFSILGVITYYKTYKNKQATKQIIPTNENTNQEINQETEENKTNNETTTTNNN